MKKFTKLTTHIDDTRNACIQPLAHQKWLKKEIQKGIAAADRGELLSDYEVENWFQSIGAAS